MHYICENQYTHTNWYSHIYVNKNYKIINKLKKKFTYLSLYAFKYIIYLYFCVFRYFFCYNKNIQRRDRALESKNINPI